MALIKCPECGHLISEYAFQCISCGCPMDKIKELLRMSIGDHIDEVKGKEKIKKDIDTPLNDEEDTRLFSEKRTSYEQYVIKTFKDKISQKISDLITRDSQYMYSFRITKRNGELATICWFSNGEKNKLAFKYYKDPHNKLDPKTIYPVSKDIPHLLEVAMSSYSILQKPNPIVPQYVPDYNEEEDIEESLGTPLIYELIIKAIRGKTLKGPAELVKTAKEVGDVVLTEIRYKSIEEKAFNSVEEFDKYKNSYKFVANFFGCRFSLKHLSIADAKNIYLTFKAYKLIEICKVQEKIYNAKVSTDRQATLEDFKKMIEDKDYNFSLARGLTLYFRYVPTEQMVQCVKELNELEKVYK